MRRMVQTDLLRTDVAPQEFFIKDMASKNDRFPEARP
jgi:hypothetical protein